MVSSLSRWRAFLKRASFSLAGHIVLCAIFWGGPIAILFTWIDYSDGRLTIVRAVWSVFIASIGALAFAVFLWHVVSKPLLRRRGKI